MLFTLKISLRLMQKIMPSSELWEISSTDMIFFNSTTGCRIRMNHNWIWGGKCKYTIGALQNIVTKSDIEFWNQTPLTLCEEEGYSCRCFKLEWRAISARFDFLNVFSFASLTANDKAQRNQKPPLMFDLESRYYQKSTVMVFSPLVVVITFKNTAFTRP